MYKIIIILILIVLSLYIMHFIVIRLDNNNIESFVDTQFIESDKIYDSFYCNIYDQLFLNKLKVQREVEDLELNILKGKIGLKLLDIGCGTGHHLKKFSEKYNVTGLDNSNEMLKISKHKNPKLRLVLGDAIDKELFPKKNFDIITCFYFTIYYFRDLNQFISNVHYWLKPLGIFCVNVVNKDRFDPLLELGSPLSPFSLQKYSKIRLTKTVVHFNNFVYKSNFIKKKNNHYEFEESFEYKKKPKIRKQTHQFYMFKINTFIELMNTHGFKQLGQSDLMNCGFEYQYNLYFKKR